MTEPSSHLSMRLIKHIFDNKQPGCPDSGNLAQVTPKFNVVLYSVPCYGHMISFCILQHWETKIIAASALASFKLMQPYGVIDGFSQRFLHPALDCP